MRNLSFVLPPLLSLTLLLGAADPDKQPKGPQIEIRNMKFNPAELKAKVGETVTWTNTDDRDHTVTADDAKTFSSGNIKRNATFQFKFTKPGKYPYSCTYHPRMKGTITITE